MLTRQWGQIIEGVATYASMAKSYLVDGKPLEVHPDRVVIGFDPEFAANREKLSVSRSVKGVQKVLGDFLKRPVSVEFVVIGQAAPAGGSGAGPGEKPAPARPGNHRTKSRAAAASSGWTNRPSSGRWRPSTATLSTCTSEALPREERRDAMVDMMKLMKQAASMQKNMQKLQAELAEKRYEFTSGAAW